MLKRIILFTLFFVAFIFLQSCQQDAPASSNFAYNSSADDASLLLLSDDDPSGLEKNASPAFMLDNRGMLLFHLLDLSTEQKDSIRAIHQSYRSEFKGLQHRWHRKENSWQEIKAHRDSIHTLIHNEILSFLSEEQLHVLNEIETQLANGEYPDALVAYRVAKMDELLNLNDEQEAQVAELIKDYGSRILEARNTSENREQFMKERKALGEELNDVISALLTDEQLEVYKDFMKDKHRKMRKRNRHKNH